MKDVQRYILIGSIAILSYLLLVEWGNYKSAQNQPAATSTAAIPGSFADSNAQTVPAAQDLPSSPATAPTATNSVNNSGIVRVFSDALELHISLQGGDIIYAALPKYYAVLDQPDKPFVLLEQNEHRTYIAQSGLIGKNGTDTQAGRPLFQSELTEYRLAENSDELVVDLHYQTNEQITIIKRYRIHRGDYLIDLEYLIDNRSEQAWTAGLFAQLKRDNSIDPTSESSSMGMAPFLGTALTLPDEPFKKISFADMAEKDLKVSHQGGWIAMIQHYFLSAWVPDAELTHNFSTTVTTTGDNIIRFTSPQVTVNPQQSGVVKAQFYAGPKDQYRLEQISKGLELSVDYGWLWWIAQPLFWLLTKIHGLVGNWGWAIIGVTLLVKILFFQLNATAYRSMANMRKVGPKLTALRERYADDKQRQSQEMMNLYKKEKINPLGGCLPILVQMPVFIALYWVLLESVELRHAPFMLWIHDLSVMDPYYVLPLIMGVSMFFQQKLNPPPPDPMQAKIMQWLPVIFTFFFLFFPAGLVLYWVVNNILSIAQQYIITKQIENS